MDLRYDQEETTTKGNWSMSKRFLSAAAVGALAFSALGAGGTGVTGQQPSVSGKITIIAKWTGDWERAFEAVLAPFERAHPAVSIKYIGAGDYVAPIVAKAVSGRYPPNLATLSQPSSMTQFVEQGAAKPIGFAREVIAQNYAPVWLDVGSVNGKLYGLFFAAYNKSIVWYNVSAFKKAGVRPPSTFAQFLEVAKAIRASGLPAYSIGARDSWTLTDLFENIYLRQAGPAKYDLLSSHKIKWTDASVKAALKVMGQIIGDASNIAGSTSGALQTDLPTSVRNVFVAPPKAAMVIEGDFVPGVAGSSTKVKPISGYNQFPFPSIKPSTKGSVMGIGDVLVMFRDSLATEALLKYLATPQAATIWAKRTGVSSPNRNVEPRAYSDPLTRATAIALARAPIFRYDMSDLQPPAFAASPRQGELKLFQDFVSNPKNVDAIAARLEAAAANAGRK
jgi:alpha-glucoside transport system substrate-binding protein